MTAPPLKVAVLGATGAVGQRFVAQLADHPWFEITHLAASQRSAGRSYRDACRWRLSQPMPAATADLQVADLEPDAEIDLAFSALGADVAQTAEPTWAGAGVAVFSNARSFRMAPDVPLLIPELNPEHLALIETQVRARGFPEGGFIATNPNCSATFLAMALAPLHRAFGVRRAMVVTMQAISGAGYPGLSALDIDGNVIPFIDGEEEKLESETQKMLGRFADAAVQPASFTISAQVNRVPVVDGHTESISVELAGSPDCDAVRRALAGFVGEPQRLALPSAPPRPILVLEEPDRPQPRLDAERERGMVVHVGGIRPCPVLGTKFTVLGHNTIRGAAGGSVLNAELAYTRGLLRREPDPELVGSTTGAARSGGR